MEKVLEIRNNGEIFIDDCIPGFNLFSICGCRQSSRDYAGSWSWHPENEDEVHIYISTELNKDEILLKIEPLLISAIDCNGLDSSFQDRLDIRNRKTKEQPRIEK